MTAGAGLRLETWVADTSEVSAWLKSARAGARFIYARAARLPARSPTAARLRALAQAGLVDLTQRAAGGGLFDYQARRLAPVKIVLRRPPRALTPDGDMARVLRVLQSCANAMPPRPCPANRDLARQVGMCKPHQASYVMSKLTNAGIIASEIVDAASGARVVTIRATGKRTAPPSGHLADE